MNSVFSDVFHDFVSLFFPRYCAACEDALVKGEDLICSKCILEMGRTDYHLDQENPFYQKLKVRVKVRYVLSLFRFSKSGRVQKLLHTFKYKNKPEIGVMLGKVYGNVLLNAGYAHSFDIVIPVPLHKIRKRQRGYNQSEQFGKGLAEALGVSCSDEWMVRVYQTQTQTRKTRLKRWENVKEVFKVTSPENIRDKKILLVDDVVTTGATLEAAAAVLLEAGCFELSIACIAATQ
jgi:ComF family protein